MYVAFSITTSFSALYPGSCLLRDKDEEWEIKEILAVKKDYSTLKYHAS